MRGINLFVFAVMFVVVVNVGIALGDGTNVSPRDYRPPISSARSLFFDFNGNLDVRGDELMSGIANLGLSYKYFHDSLPFGAVIDVKGSFSLENEKDVGTSLSYFDTAIIRVKKYLIGDLFGGVRLDETYFDLYDQPDVSMSLGLGYGRFIDATALAKAVRIEDMLIEDGVLNARLSREEMLELAGRIDRRSEYSQRYGSGYRAKWYEDMASIIRSSGKLGEDEITAVGILRMQEVVNEQNIADRLYGWDIAVGVRQEILLSERGQPKPDPEFDLSAHYAVPLGWRIIWREEAVVNTPFTRDALDHVKISLSSVFVYEIADRVNFNVDHVLRIDRLPEKEKPVMSNILDIGFVFHVENRINLVLREKISKSGSRKLKTDFLASLNYRVF